MPGIWVREFTVEVPLDWAAPQGKQIRVLVRELVDPERRDEELPLLTYLQGGPGGACPRPTERSGWIAEALEEYRIILVDQRGTGGSSRIEGRDLAAFDDAESAAAHLALFRADSIVRDLEHVRTTVYAGAPWSTLGQSYGGWITLRYLSTAPEGLSACYVGGGIPGIGVSAAEVYRRTFDRVAAKSRAHFARYPGDVAQVSRIADRLAVGDVYLPDGDLFTVERFQTLGIELGMQRGSERLHWLLESAFRADGELTEEFLAGCLALTSSARNPLYWTLQEAIYADAGGGATAWAAQAERDRRPELAPERRPLALTGEMAFPWMFEQVRLLRPFRDAVQVMAARTEWRPLYDLDRLAANTVPLVAAVYFDDMYVDSGLQLDTLARIGASQAWVTSEHEHDGLANGGVFPHLRRLLRTGEGRRRVEPIG